MKFIALFIVLLSSGAQAGKWEDLDACIWEKSKAHFEEIQKDYEGLAKKLRESEKIDDSDSRINLQMRIKGQIAENIDTAQAEVEKRVKYRKLTAQYPNRTLAMEEIYPVYYALCSAR
jgi:hypothetical protein